LRLNRFEGNNQAIALTGDAVQVEENTVSAAATGGGGLVALRDGANALVRGNTLTGGSSGLVLSSVQGAAVEGNTIMGAGARGISVELTSELPAAKALVIARNQIVGNGVAPGGAPGAGILLEGDASADDPVVIANRFVGQAANGVPGVRLEAGETPRRVAAANNWWGCNGGPGSAGCDTTETAGEGSSVATNPRLVLSAAATPSVVVAPGVFRLSAGIQRNSAGLEVPEIALLDPLPFEFANVSGAAAITERVSSGGGGAQASLESASVGRAVVRASLDAAAVDVSVYFSPVPVAPTAPGPAPPGTDTKVPRLRDLTATRTGRGATFRFTLSEPAVVRFALERTERGRASGARCVAVRRASRCVRRIRSGSFSMSGVTGVNARPFFGRVGKRRLRPGIYRATLVAIDGAGNAGTPKRVAFEIGPR
jgi:hypothetical protein